jgi:hypothetical protein
MIGVGMQLASRSSTPKQASAASSHLHIQHWYDFFLTDVEVTLLQLDGREQERCQTLHIHEKYKCKHID